MKQKARFLLPLLVLLLLAGTFTSACGSTTTQDEYQALPMAPFHDMPAEIKEAPFKVQEAYQFAFANQDVLSEIPCYCGCGNLGHVNNYDCYVAEVDAAGTIQFDPHALACSICVDITQDTMRMMRTGEDVATIRDYIDTTYARSGPSNMPDR
jgi:hypothetical protein